MLEAKVRNADSSVNQDLELENQYNDTDKTKLNAQFYFL